MQNLNNTLFAIFNASATPPAFLVQLAEIFAEWVIFAVAIALVWGWLRSGASGRKQLVVVGLTIFVALAVNMLISAFWYHPRPFEIGAGNQLLAHAADNSFPSDHATVMFAVAFGLIAARAPALWSSLVMLLALGVAWSRVYLGVHWPLDMAGSFGVALGAAWLARISLRSKPGQRLSHQVLKIYDSILSILHIPASVSRPSFTAK